MYFNKKMKSLGGCEPAVLWSEGKTSLESYNTCHVGEWMAATYELLNPKSLNRFKYAALIAEYAYDRMSENVKQYIQIAKDYSENKISSLDFKRHYHLSQKLIHKGSIENLTVQQCADNAAISCLSGSISQTIKWLVGKGNEQEIQQQCADLIRLHIPYQEFNYDETL